MATLSLNALEKSYGSFKAVSGVSLEVGQSEFIALLGPSGCGKTTLLRMIAGFIEPTAGRISIGSRDVTRDPPHKRNAGMVFQSYALFPHMTVAANVTFGLRMRSLGTDEIDRRSREALNLVQLDHLASRYPRELSGGQQQRVALARALIIEPDVFLLDEPLSNLDAKLRQNVGMEMRMLQQKLGLTTVFVTHDQNEALALADRVVIMNEGKLVQSGRASELYSRPVDTFVASFLGKANLLPGRVIANSRFLTDSGNLVHCESNAMSAGDRAVLCLRPENVEIAAESSTSLNSFPAHVVSRTYLGAAIEYVVHLNEGGTHLTISITNRAGARSAPVFEPSGSCHVHWGVDSAILLPEK